MRATEAQIQSAYFKILQVYKFKYPALTWIHHIPNGGARHPAVAKKLKSQGVTSGVFDVFIPCEGTDSDAESFNGFYIEFKRDAKQKLTKNQTEFKSFVETQGYKTAVFSDAWEAFLATCNYLGIPKKEK